MASSKLPDGDASFSYFSGNYRWSHGMLLPLGGTQWGGGKSTRSIASGCG
jgi:hypothetical protein